MSVFYVYQGKTYTHERAGSYVWSPKVNKIGQKNKGYKNMELVKKGDIVFNHANKMIRAISIAKTDCYDSVQPQALKDAEKDIEWGDDGYRVDLDYCDLDVPFAPETIRDWLANHWEEDSAFKNNGGSKLSYMNRLPDYHARYILSHIIPLQTSQATIDRLNAILLEIIDDSDAEYDEIEIEDINRIVETDNNPSESIVFTHTQGQQATTISSNTGKVIAKRDPAVAAKALKRVKYVCEADINHKPFLRKNNTNYTESHHLIPISKYKDFADKNLDTLENIVSLCPNCHRLLHHGRLIDKTLILKSLLERRQTHLEQTGIDITLEQLLKYYK